MLLALRIAISSDKLLLLNSQKEHRKTHMEDGNTIPMLLQFSNERPSGMHTDQYQCETEVDFLEMQATYNFSRTTTHPEACQDVGMLPPLLHRASILPNALDNKKQCSPNKVLFMQPLQIFGPASPSPPPEAEAPVMCPGFFSQIGREIGRAHV